MKRQTYIIAALWISVLSFTAADKLMTVSYSLDVWQQKLNIIEAAKTTLKNSNAPANVVMPLTDSLTKFQMEIANQVRVQMDTTKKK